MSDWYRYLSGVADPRRRAKLRRRVPFARVIQAIVAGSPPPRRKMDKGKNGPHLGARRVTWIFKPNTAAGCRALDYFFNGRNGYRAAYERGAAFGRKANRLAVAILSERLGEQAANLGESAKVWIADDAARRALESGEFSRVEIWAPHWVRAARRGIAVLEIRGRNGAKRPGLCKRYKAAAGILASAPSRLVLRGSWVPAAKRSAKPASRRESQLCQFGYT